MVGALDRVCVCPTAASTLPREPVGEIDVIRPRLDQLATGLDAGLEKGHALNEKESPKGNSTGIDS